MADADTPPHPDQRPAWGQPAFWLKGVTTLLLIAGILWFLDDSKTVATQKSAPHAFKGNDQRTALPVTVITVLPKAKALKIVISGITEARWLTSVLSTIHGQVASVPAALRPGLLIQAGDELVQFRQTGFRTELADATAAVAEAELQLASIKREQHVARHLNRGQQSAFGQFEPHVTAATARLAAATAAQQQAKQQLDDTRLVSPFDALILVQDVTSGQWRSTGDELYRLVASDTIDVRVELSQHQWQRLAPIHALQSIQIEADAQRLWPAHVRYISPVIDPVTRQRSLVLTVQNPYHSAFPLLPDEHVRVHFVTPKHSHLVQAPASVLTDDGQVWTVFNDRLTLEAVDVLEHGPEQLLLRFVKSPEKARQLVRFPISTLLQGQYVDVRHEKQPDAKNAHAAEAERVTP